MKKIALLLVLACFGLGGRAQRYIDYRQTTVYVGAAVPRGQLADYVSGGVNFGVKEIIPVKKHLSLMVSADVFHNNVSSGAHEITGFTPDKGYTYKGTSSITDVPLFAHLYLGFHADRHNNLRLWMEGAGGVNARFIGKEYWHLNRTVPYSIEGVNADIHEQCDIVSTFKPTLSLAYQWGLGVTLLRRYSVGCVWYNLGKRTVEGHNEISNSLYSLDDGNPVSIGRTPDIPTTFDYGRLRSRYRAIRFGLTF